MTIQRTPVNSWYWSLNLNYNQGEIIDGPSRQLICAGQTAVDGEGNPQHPDDMRRQISLTLDNLGAVLAGADMTLSNITRLSVYATDVDVAPKNFGLLGMRFEPVKCAPPMTLTFASRTDPDHFTFFKMGVRALCCKGQEKQPKQTFSLFSAVMTGKTRGAFLGSVNPSPSLELP